MTQPSGTPMRPAAEKTHPIFDKSISFNDSEFDCFLHQLPAQRNCNDESQWSLTPPPVDHISIYSDFDSSSDVSSISSDDDTVASVYDTSLQPKSELPAVPARSIFGRYWDTNPSESPVFKATRIRSQSVSSTRCSTLMNDYDDDDFGHNNNCAVPMVLQVPSTFDGVPRANVLSPSCSSERRRLFEFRALEDSPITPVSFLQSPLLTDDVLPMRCLVRCLSSSTQASKPSCLRSSRYGSDSSKRQVSVTSFGDMSVSFSPKVDVMVYTRPSEVWAANGWVDYFS